VVSDRLLKSKRLLSLDEKLQIYTLRYIPITVENKKLAPTISPGMKLQKLKNKQAPEKY